jgi:DNA-binding PadR family transcriptional regulator
VTPPVNRADIQAFLPLQPRDYLVLFALAEGPGHGYAILKSIESSSGGVPFDPANLYRSLRRLAREGLVMQVSERERGAGGPPRRSYSLTALGRRVLAAEATRLASLADAARARHLVSRS